MPDSSQMRSRYTHVAKRWLAAIAAICCFAQSAQAQSASTTVKQLEPIAEQITVSGIGYGQGVLIHEGHVYLYGDADTGVIREYDWSPDQPHQLKYTGLEIQLTRNGVDIAPHPTGLTIHPENGAFLGDTVNQKGTIFWIDWEQAKQDGNLDHAIKNMVSDDMALNGTRPEFVKVEGQWLIATSDYGPEGNEVRLYDPALLKKVTRTSSPDVLVFRQDCGPWVQTVEWVPEWNSLALVQNQIEGLRYRLTFTRWNDRKQASFSPPHDLGHPIDELEGWGYLGDGWSLYLSSSLKKNVAFGRVILAP